MIPPAGESPRHPPDHSQRAAAADEDAQSLLDSAVSGIVQALGGRAGLVRLWGEHPDREIASSSYGLSDEAIDRLRPLVNSLIPRLGTGPTDTEPARFDLAPTGDTPRRPLQVVALPLRTNGRLIGMLCLFQEPAGGPEPVWPRLTGEQVDVVVQNARLLERLVEEKRWLEAVVRYSADGIMILDAQGRIIGLNPAFERLIGWPVDEARGHDYTALLDPRTPAGAAIGSDLLFVSWAETGGSLTQELTYQRKNGTRVDVEASFSIIRNESDRVLGAIIGARDITVRREAEELQNTFLSVISHELQTPITIIQGYADLLADPEMDLPRDEMQRKLAIIKDEGKRLQSMVENLLTASRLQAGTIELRPEPLDPAFLLTSLVQRLRVAHRGRTIELRLPDDLPAVVADAERIEQVLSNLIENAIKYTPSTGHITVGGRATGTDVIFMVTDQGAGIPAADRERIFDRFQRLDSRLVRTLKGAGLGLYVCRAIVEAHGGRIWVEEAPGGGASFNFTLPRQQAASLPIRFRR